MPRHYSRDNSTSIYTRTRMHRQTRYAHRYASRQSYLNICMSLRDLICEVISHFDFICRYVIRFQPSSSLPSVYCTFTRADCSRENRLIFVFRLCKCRRLETRNFREVGTFLPVEKMACHSSLA